MTLKIKNAKVCGNGKFKHSPKKYSKKNQKKGKGKKQRLCGACIIINILTGDTNIIKGYFYKMLSNRKFKNIKKLPVQKIEFIADDLCQNVYEALLLKFENGDLQKVKYFKSYIWKITMFKAYDINKYIGKMVEFDTNKNDALTKTIDNSIHVGVGESPEAFLINKQIKNQKIKIVRSVLKKLTPFERFLVCCIYYEDLSNKEVVEIIGENDNYVGVILYNLRKKIRGLILKNQKTKIVRKEIKSLTPFERFLVCCIYYEWLSYSEVANIIGETRNYTSAILFKLREKLGIWF